MRSAWVRWGLPAVLLALAGTLLLATQRIERRADSPYPVVPTLQFSSGAEALARSGAGWRADTVYGAIPVELPLRAGQTVGGVLAELDLEGRDVQSIVGELSEFADLRRLKPQDSYAVVTEPDGGIVAFDLTLAGRGRVRVAREPNGWQGSWREFQRQRQIHVVRGSLEGALESSIDSAGGDGRLAFLLSDVFQWDLDFHRDLRLGDEFEIVYEKVLIDGSYSTLGEILAVHYTNLGRTIEAYRFGDPAGYYDGEGRPLRKMFLRSPLRYSRVTSRYSPRRFHPVLKRYRPHYGVDYGAPTGTPVRVTANGVVSSASWDKGGGKMVKVRHPNGYLTAYLHLSGYAKGVKSGRRVAQGDVIGYVGSTGLSTAPHLDYRVQIHGKWMDPLSLKSVPAEPIPAETTAEFRAWRDAFRESMGGGTATTDLLDLRAEAEAREVEAELAVAVADAAIESAGS